MVTREGKEINLDFESHKNQLEGESLEEFEDLEKRLEEDNKDDILRQMGSLFRRNDVSCDIALEYYLEAERINPDNPRIQTGIGLTHKKKGEEESAIEHLGRAVSIDPHKEIAYRNLMEIFAENEEFKNIYHIFKYVKEAGEMKGYPLIEYDDSEEINMKIYELIGLGASLEDVEKGMDCYQNLLYDKYRRKKNGESLSRVVSNISRKDENNNKGLTASDIKELKENNIDIEKAQEYDFGFTIGDMISLIKGSCPPELAAAYNDWDVELLNYMDKYDKTFYFNGEEILALRKLGITPEMVKERENKRWIFHYIFTFLNLSEKEDFDFVSTGNYGVILKTRDFACKLSQEPAHEMNLLRRVRDSNSDLENVIALKDDVMTENNHMIRFVLEHINGETLESKIINDGPFSSEDVIRYGCDISNGLKEMRRGGVWFHRDIRPKNIMLDEYNDKGVIIDLGLASTDKNATPKGNRRFGGENDLVSLGQLMYYLATGEHIFDESGSYLEIGEDVAEQIRVDRNEIYDDPRLLQKYLKKVYTNLEDDRLKDLVVDCLTGKRYHLGILRRKFDYYLDDGKPDIENLRAKIRSVSSEEREFKIKRSAAKSDSINIDEILGKIERERRSILTKKLFVEGLSHSHRNVRIGTALELDSLSRLDSQMYLDVYDQVLDSESDNEVKKSVKNSLHKANLSEGDFIGLFRKTMDRDLQFEIGSLLKRVAKTDYQLFEKYYQELDEKTKTRTKMWGSDTFNEFMEDFIENYPIIKNQFSEIDREQVFGSKREPTHSYIAAINLPELAKIDEDSFLRSYHRFIRCEGPPKLKIAESIGNLADIDLDKFLELYENGIKDPDDDIRYGTAKALASLVDVDENKFVELFERGINSEDFKLKLGTMCSLSKLSRIDPDKYVNYIEKYIWESDTNISKTVSSQLGPLVYIDKDKFFEFYLKNSYRPDYEFSFDVLGELANVDTDMFVKLYEGEMKRKEIVTKNYLKKTELAKSLHKLASANPNEYLRLYRQAPIIDDLSAQSEIASSIKGLAESVFDENIVPLEDDEYEFMVEYLNSDYVRRGEGYKPHEEIVGELKMLAHERIRDYGRLTALLREGQAKDLEEIIELGQMEHSEILPVKKLGEREYLTNEGRVIELVDVLDAQEEGYLVECDYEPFYAFEKEVSRDE